MLSSRLILRTLRSLPSKRVMSTTQTAEKLIVLVREKNYSAIQTLAKQNPNAITYQTNHDNTALHEAAKNGDIAGIIHLAKTFPKSFNVNQKCHCKLQRTALHYAIRCGIKTGNFEAAELLLGIIPPSIHDFPWSKEQCQTIFNASPNIKNENGKSVIDILSEALEKNSFNLSHVPAANKTFLLLCDKSTDPLSDSQKKLKTLILLKQELHFDKQTYINKANHETLKLK